MKTISSESLASLVLPNVKALSAYEAKDVPCRIKLDANESPYNLPPEDMDRVSKAISTLAFNRYPDPQARKLRGLLARRYKVKQDQVLLGNGSDELISMLISCFGGPVLYPVPTFSMYGIITRGAGRKSVEVKLDEDFDIDTDRMLAGLKRAKPKLVFLSMPNNPTGNCFSLQRVLKIIEAATGVVVVDEAYQAFIEGSGFLPALKDHRNVVILRTLSKVGLASLRLGVMIASEEIIAEVNKVRLPFNVNTLSQEVAIQVFSGNKKPFAKHVKLITQERDRIFKALAEINGVNVYPSKANFILFKLENPAMIYNRLLKKGILVRNLDKVVKGCLRVTVGTPEENSTFIEALSTVIK